MKGFFKEKFLRKDAIGLVAFIIIFNFSLKAQSGINLDLLNQGYRALDNWEYLEAEEIASQIQEQLSSEENPDRQTRAYFFLAQYWFHRGDYARALEELETSQEINSSPDSAFNKFYERVKYLAELFAEAQESSSAHFRIRWTDPRDQVLAKPALEALEQAYSTLGRDFNFTPKGDKILVEIYPAPKDLAIAVGLEEQMLKDSGTIAICKFRRLMLTSPRSLLYGYDYLNTASHELVHFFIYSMAGNKVPIWLHEGIAKYEELSYLGKAGELAPVQKSLLVSAIRNNELITFAQMSPTFAQFKSPKQGQLAFAEVATMVDYLKQNCGANSWFQIFQLLNQGKSDREALKIVCQKDFSTIWQDWQKWVLAKNWPVIPSAVVLKMEFKEQEQEESEEELELGTDEEKSKAWDWVRLGDLLRDRRYYQASVQEYKKALELLPYQPQIMNKLGLAQILAQDYASAIAILKKATEVYPGYSTSFVNLGRAYQEAGEVHKAIETLENALKINPFNPTIYRRLIQLYQKAGDSARVQQLQASLEIIKKTRG